MSKLFDSSEIDTPARQEPEPDAHTIDGNFDATLGKVGQVLQEVIGTVPEGCSKHYVTAGRWSAHDLLNYFVKQSHPADVYLTTYAMSEEAARLMCRLKDQGLIRELCCVFDKRMTVRSPKALQLAQYNFTNIYQVDCHAKVTVIQSHDHHISMVGSNNYSSNRRIEAGVVTNSREIAEFHKGWIEDQIAGKKPLGR